MFGDRSFESIKELHRHEKGGTIGLTTFDESGVRLIYDEMKALFELNQEDASNSTPGDVNTLASLHLRHAALERNKQCVLGYVVNRMDRIRDLRWLKGSVLSQPDRINMTTKEVDYFTSYNRLLASYMKSLQSAGMGDGEGLDLTQDLQPPKSIMIRIRVLKDYGEFEVDGGEVVILHKNGIHYLPRFQCEALIQQGVVQVVDH